MAYRPGRGLDGEAVKRLKARKEQERLGLPSEDLSEQANLLLGNGARKVEGRRWCCICGTCGTQYYRIVGKNLHGLLVEILLEPSFISMDSHDISWLPDGAEFSTLFSGTILALSRLSLTPLPRLSIPPRSPAKHRCVHGAVGHPPRSPAMHRSVLDHMGSAETPFEQVLNSELLQLKRVLLREHEFETKSLRTANTKMREELEKFEAYVEDST
eukprot:g13480.t1